MHVIASPSVVSSLAPGGCLRAVINLGNPILAGLDVHTQEPRGVSVDLARHLASRLDVALELVTVDAAGQSVAVVTRGEADVGFFAIDPVRGQDIAFTPPYVLIEGCYLVRENSPIQAHEQVDRNGITVMVGKGSAYDLFLSRELVHAEIVRSQTSPTVVDTFIETRADVAAGVKQQLEADARRLGGLRLLNGRFMVIQQAMGLPKRSGHEAAEFLSAFVDEAKRTGFISNALRRHHIEGASIAPES